MATTLHLGDCLSDCIICEHRYHEQFNDKTCDTCGRDFTSKTEWRIG